MNSKSVKTEYVKSIFNDFIDWERKMCDDYVYESTLCEKHVYAKELLDDLLDLILKKEGCE